jgi:hypothetical protein
LSLTWKTNITLALEGEIGFSRQHQVKGGIEDAPFPPFSNLLIDPEPAQWMSASNENLITANANPPP